MYRTLIASFCLLISASFLSTAVFADDLKMPIGSQGQKDIKRPSNGMSKADVESRYGAPENRKAAVGEPPISIWKYRNYSVYFEYDRVIHTVLHK